MAEEMSRSQNKGLSRGSMGTNGYPHNTSRGGGVKSTASVTAALHNATTPPMKKAASLVPGAFSPQMPGDKRPVRGLGK